VATRVASIRSIDPATEEVIATFEPFDDEQIERVLEQARGAFRAWRGRSFAERAVPMKRLAGILRERADRYAGLMTAEMGKPLAEAKAEIEKCAWNCEFYAANAATFLADEPAPSNGKRSYVAFDPLGIVLAVMPWNYPFWQVIRFAAPALMAGNAAVLKHASNVSQCALAVEEAVRDAGFPEGLFRTVLLAGADVEPLIGDDRVSAITLTGSSATGSRIAELAGRALKKCVLELGGSDPFIVLDDVDPVATAARAAAARVQNSGQSCIAAKRFIVLDRVASSFERALVERMRSLLVGDPSDRATEVGPLARADLLDALHAQVAKSLEQGARLALADETKRPLDTPTTKYVECPSTSVIRVWIASAQSTMPKRRCPGEKEKP